MKNSQHSKIVEVINYLQFMQFHVNYEVLALQFEKLLRANFTMPMNIFLGE